MAKKEAAVGSERFYHANLAIMAEEAGNYLDAAGHWRKASAVSSEPAKIVLYEEAAKRCERKANEIVGD